MFVDLKMSLIDCNLYEEEVGVVHLAVTNSCRGRGGVRRKIQIEWCNETEVCGSVLSGSGTIWLGGW